MAIVTGPKLGLLYNANINENYVDSFRIFLQSLDQLIMGSVINATSVVPPTSPAPGDAYLLPISPVPTGAWVGQAGKIAVWDAQLTNSGTNTVVPGWLFFAPKPGWLLWNTAVGALFVFNGGAWSPISAGIVAPVASYADQIGSGTVSATANVIKTWAFNLNYQVTADSISYDVTTADNSGNLYSICLYDNSGNILASTGALPGSSFCATTGYQNQNLVGQTVFVPGNYFLALTTDAGTAAFATAPSQFLATSAHNSGASTGGTLPSTISIPPTSWSIDTSRPAISLH